jgi:hypothetical protein
VQQVVNHMRYAVQVEKGNPILVEVWAHRSHSLSMWHDHDHDHVDVDA